MVWDAWVGWIIAECRVGSDRVERGMVVRRKSELGGLNGLRSVCQDWRWASEADCLEWGTRDEAEIAWNDENASEKNGSALLNATQLARWDATSDCPAMPYARCVSVYFVPPHLMRNCANTGI